VKKVLFIHQNYPGQFLNLAPALACDGWDVRALRQGSNAGRRLPSEDRGVRLLGWQAQRGTTLAAHPWVQDTETKIIRAEATAQTCEHLRNQGWTPDLLVGHPGWGEMLFLKHIWPDVPQLHFLEFHYAAQGLDVGFDAEFALKSWQEAARVTAKAGPSLLNLEAMTVGLSPTQFQASTYPSWAQDRINVIHDGIDTKRIHPNPLATWKWSERGIELKHGDPVITFVNRNLEPYRGYHRLMRSLPRIQEACPEAITVIVGGSGVSYGAAAPDGKAWKDVFMKEVEGRIDMSRVVFTGILPYSHYIGLLQVSACHIYFSYPFVLGWSCLEAMSAGALVVGSATPPVEEVIEDGTNGFLADFFDSEALVKCVRKALDGGEKIREMRQNARTLIESKYDLYDVCLPKQLRLLQETAV
jgi:glycosyltransferase involved in cell wall biosynthesis